MASSSHSHGTEKEEELSFLNRRPGKEAAGTRNLLEDLPLDVTITILQKLGTIDLLLNTQNVCVEWRKICKDPRLWRSIDMRRIKKRRIIREFKELFYDDIYNMTKHAIDRSCGQLVDINLEYYAGHKNILKCITDSTNQVRCLRIVDCWLIRDEDLSEAAKKLPSMEELHIHFGNITNVGLENVGRSCPGLKSLTYNPRRDRWRRMGEIHHNIDALSISRTMPQLHHLSLIGNRMSNKGLEAILDACPHLESLDLRKCFSLNLSGPLGKRCSSSIKALRLPHDSTPDYEFDAKS